MLKLHHPSSLIICGSSSCGKTELCKLILKKNVYDGDIKNIIWSYSVWDNWFLTEKNIKFVQGLPNDDNEVDLLIIDDQMNNITPAIAEMFTVRSHHKNFSIILITQNLFPRVKCFRDISLNAHYIILFRNNRDLSQISCFGKQMFPGRLKYFLDAYKKATEKPFSYLLIDCHPLTTDEYKLRDSLFPEYGNIYWIYLPLEK